MERRDPPPPARRALPEVPLRRSAVPRRPAVPRRLSSVAPLGLGRQGVPRAGSPARPPHPAGARRSPDARRTAPGPSQQPASGPVSHPPGPALPTPRGDPDPVPGTPGPLATPGLPGSYPWRRGPRRPTFLEPPLVLSLRLNPPPPPPTP